MLDSEEEVIGVAWEYLGEEGIAGEDCWVFGFEGILGYWESCD